MKKNFAVWLRFPFIIQHVILKEVERQTYFQPMFISKMQVIHDKGSVLLFMSTEMLERRSEILKRNIHQLLVQENQHGVTRQENYTLHKMIRELHQTSHALNTSR
ncbi:hypothetical protein [Paenibacillus sp. IHB B 3084]|uniref:hypothetical protein n=2 Tax=Paenibacillus TaxID=44249 RepID=UPI0016705760|nr:hypothetical protein [Paenibacillus sp. IHB B 3084]